MPTGYSPFSLPLTSQQPIYALVLPTSPPLHPHHLTTNLTTSQVNHTGAKTAKPRAAGRASAADAACGGRVVRRAAVDSCGAGQRC
jgi:hypothetical protein